jgi:PAS domain-containing protein
MAIESTAVSDGDSYIVNANKIFVTNGGVADIFGEFSLIRRRVYDIETYRFLTVNDSAVKHYGYTRDEFLSMTIKDIRPAEDVAPFMENVSRVTTGLDKAGVWRHRKKDGCRDGSPGRVPRWYWPG